LEHGRLRTARKKIEEALGGPLVIFIEGGLVQDVGRVRPSGFLAVEYDLVDYDVLDQNSPADVKEYWDRRSDEAKEYLKNFVPDSYDAFQKAME